MSTATLSTSPTNAPPLSLDALEFVCTLVQNLSAIELDSSKGYLIEARLANLARQCGFVTSTKLVQELRSKRQPALVGQVVDAMTTNETSFFRDIHPFDALRTTVLPELRGLLGEQRELNIWSAACSSGQELYSFAMLLREHFPDFGSWNVKLLGTDLSDEILERARKASFSQIEVNRGLVARLLIKYFERDGIKWQLRSDLKAMATFSKLNLIDR